MMPISRITDLSKLKHEFLGGIVAIGNFDGVHRGHRSVLKKALQLAALLNKPSLVLTFEPHPRAVFQPETPVFRLTPAAIKARHLQEMGFHCVIEQEFSQPFSRLTANEFIQTILLDGLHAHHIVTGFDFHFGKKREGGPAFLMHAGKERGFDVTLVDALRDDTGTVISSSRIRELLSLGDVAQAADLLSYPYSVIGRVIKGKQLGRTLGFPTINMELEVLHPLKYGIYAVYVTRETGEVHQGVASFGCRPSVENNGAPLLETFIFDFNADLYDQRVTITFISYLRGEEKFESLEELVVQMNKDSENAKKRLTYSENIKCERFYGHFSL